MWRILPRCHVVPKIVLADPSIRLVVVSASSGVTNLLVDITRQQDPAARLLAYAGVERITYAVLQQLQQQALVAVIEQLLLELKTLVNADHSYSAVVKRSAAVFW